MWYHTAITNLQLYSYCEHTVVDSYLFYCLYTLLSTVLIGLKALWRMVSVDGVSEADIEQYLKNGLYALVIHTHILRFHML